MSAFLSAGPASGSDLFRRRVWQIPTAFGRLVYLASLRRPSNGEYVQDQLLRTLGAGAADLAIRHLHRAAFSDWLQQNLCDQKRDLWEFLQANPGKAGNLEEIVNYRDLIPPDAREIERQLYLTDLGLLVLWLRREAASPTWSPAA